MLLLLWLCVVLTLETFSALADDLTVKPIEEYVKELGYPIETHTIHTLDGYYLTYHRLPHGRAGRPAHLGKPVLYVTGLLQSSATLLAKENGLAYSMADTGLDVWLSNYRGNMYSRRHDVLDPDNDYQFWNYTLHELGTVDLSASIDYILGVTRHDRLFYMGFSMGTTVFWVLGASWPEYMDKIEAMVAIAPIARPTHCQFLLPRSKYQLLTVAVKTLMKLRVGEVFPYGENTSSFISKLCTRGLPVFCKRLVTYYNRLHEQGMAIDAIVKLIPYSPAGVSLLIILHYLQIYKSGVFQQFDYGPIGNRELYDSRTPPAYNLTTVDVPVYLVYSDRDELSDPEDVEWLSNQLPRRPQRILHNVRHFRHSDFNLNRDLNQLVTLPLTDFVKHLVARETELWHEQPLASEVEVKSKTRG